MFVLGTAGHVDHGKSVLVHALTGIDPDRLAEEKERGMTIDLGFAWLKLPSGREVGIVDVPGHERFIKNMLAGVGSIDIALLIVAADEGIMPQTREHLAILDLLQVDKGIVVITKKDLVDEDWLNLVVLDVEEAIKETTLAQAPVIVVSALTGEGLPDLVSAIDHLLESAPARKDIGRPRLAIDRVFTIAGSGTVVTGTLIDGSLSVGQEVEIVPPGLRSRLRGLQTHKRRLDVARPGSRVAANLVGIASAELKRGDVLTNPGWLRPTRFLDVRLRLISSLRRGLRHNITVSFHTGSCEVEAKIRLLEREELEPGEASWAQLALAEPVAVVKGDRFIIRSPQESVGGGDIVNTHPGRHRRFRPGIIRDLEIREKGTAQEIVVASLETKQPLEMGALLGRCELPPDEAEPAIRALIQGGKVVAAGSGSHSLLFTARGWQLFRDRVAALVGDYHRRFPLRRGMPKVELRSKLKLATHSLAGILQGLLQEGVLAEEGAEVRLPPHRAELTQGQQRQVDAFLETLARNPYAPPGEPMPEPDLLNLLIEQRRVVKVSEGVVFAASAYDEMVDRISSHMKAHGKVTLAQVRDMFGTSRKYAQALLEYLDEKKITRRVGDERVLA